ncbi:MULTISPECIES: transposase [unclassified Pseudomonas]|uniref:transposase n=1 Tax=unclassified Pseudomonas TaxID=196821 RepID=UPI001CBC92F8|nr:MULTISPECIES: transposase [unclassified Pseudomonas]
MMTGSRLVAPEGFQCLSKGVIYHFLNSNGNLNRVRLVIFSDEGKELRAELITLTRVEFEDALENGWVLEDGSSDKFPPWLAPIEGVSVTYLEGHRRSVKETYDQKVNRRFAAISDLVIRMDEIFASDNPDSIINTHAKELRPQQNAARLRLWFYTYITFGQNKWALMPPLHRIGGWNREVSPRKLGRPSRKGKRSGYPCDAIMKGAILSGFLKFRSPHKTLADIYREVITREFGCESFLHKKSAEFRHPEGKAFPSYNQFKYWIKKLISPKELKQALKGQHKARSISGSEGSFAENIVNVNQRVEFDGYYISEKLSGLTEGSAVDSYCVVRALCGLSGAVLGIGFAEGKENMDAYRMALFCMATNKVKFCELFGLEIEPWQWPTEGLSGGIVFDRGPGAGFESEPNINWLKSFELTPVYSGQSKATVESSHPRDKKSLEQPTYFHSRLNFVQMAKREILRVIEDNITSNAGARMDEDLYLAGVKPTPLGIYNYWSSRGRDSSIGMQFDIAIKTFLRPCPASIRRDAVYLYSRKYKSQALAATGIFDMVARKGVIETTVLVLAMSVRHIWIEIQGVLYELDFVRSARTTSLSSDLSLHDLQEIDQLRRDEAAVLRDEIPPSRQLIRDQFKLNTGEDWDGGERKLGRPTKGGAAQRDTDDFNRFRGKAQ